MSDITYHEKSQSDPNAAASEDTVIDVLRRSVDKRVSPILSQLHSFQRAQPGNEKLISILTSTPDTSLGVIPRRPPQPPNPIQRDRVYLLLPPPNARTVRHHPDLEWHRLRSQGGRTPVQGRHGKGPREVLARGDQGGGQGQEGAGQGDWRVVEEDSGIGWTTGARPRPSKWVHEEIRLGTLENLEPRTL